MPSARRVTRSRLPRGHVGQDSQKPRETPTCLYRAACCSTRRDQTRIERAARGAGEREYGQRTQDPVGPQPRSRLKAPDSLSETVFLPRAGGGRREIAEAPKP